jgi:hypothetical protein
MSEHPSSPPRTPDPLPAEPLSYMTPAPPAARGGWVALTLVWTAGIVGLHVLIVLTPNFEQVFKDFKVNLPELSIHWLRLMRWYHLEWGWMILTPGIIVTGVFVIIVGTRLDRRPYWLLVAASVITWLAVLVLIILVLVLPQIALIRAVSGKK